ncbi:hypothetical protein BV898_00558 [Hypsibius exemplaris]|uniref:Uncharacterized protein n=1 Tax=Hypsibius exemplaris TaxID=2072580 RepID=A0A1W0XE30_HYPEX|nr:hypothetical protein BV898_00558 [Hypsibius exemplaris]
MAESDSQKGATVAVNSCFHSRPENFFSFPVNSQNIDMHSKETAEPAGSPPRSKAPVLPSKSRYTFPPAAQTSTSSSDSDVSWMAEAGLNCSNSFAQHAKSVEGEPIPMVGESSALVDEFLEYVLNFDEPPPSTAANMVRVNLELENKKHAEDDRHSLRSTTSSTERSRTSSTGSDYLYRSEHSIPKPPPHPVIEHCDISVVRRRSSTESSGSAHSQSSFGKRRNSHPIHDFTQKIQDKAKRIIGRISHLTDDHEVLEYHVKKEEILPVDPVEAEQTRIIIDAFLNEGQVIATTELEVLEELDQTSSLDGAFDGARQEYASLVATASEAMHDFQDPENIAEILSHTLEECLPRALSPVNEMFVQHFLAEYSAPEITSPVENVVTAETGGNGLAAESLTVPETFECQDTESEQAGSDSEAPGSKPPSPHSYRFNLDSPYKRLR